MIVIGQHIPEVYVVQSSHRAGAIFQLTSNLLYLPSQKLKPDTYGLFHDHFLFLSVRICKGKTHLIPLKRLL